MLLHLCNAQISARLHIYVGRWRTKLEFWQRDQRRKIVDCTILICRLYLAIVKSKVNSNTLDENNDLDDYTNKNKKNNFLSA